MAKRIKKTQKAMPKAQEFVIVTFADDIEQAKEYESLLKTNDIPVIVKEQDNPEMDTTGAAVMVPEEYLDEAHVVIESQDAYDDFYDFSMEFDEDGDGFDDSLVDDEF